MISVGQQKGTFCLRGDFFFENSCDLMLTCWSWYQMLTCFRNASFAAWFWHLISLLISDAFMLFRTPISSACNVFRPLKALVALLVIVMRCSHPPSSTVVCYHLDIGDAVLVSSFILYSAEIWNEQFISCKTLIRRNGISQVLVLSVALAVILFFGESCIFYICKRYGHTDQGERKERGGRKLE